MRMRFFVPVTGFSCALLAFVGTLTACHHPLTSRTVARDLRVVEPFDITETLKASPVKLDDTPIPPKEGVFGSIEAILSNTGESPGDVVRLTLTDVKKYALENNLGLRVDRLDAAISEQGYVAESWKFEPVLGASATYTRDRDIFDDEAKTTVAEASVTIPNRLGGTLTLSLPYTYRDSDQLIFDGTASVPEGTSNTPGLTLSLQQPLLRNAGLSVNYATINQAGLRARQADARMKLATIRLLALAEQSYWRYYVAYENLRIQKDKYDLAREQLRFAQRMVEEGVRTKVEVTRAAAGVAREFEAVIRAETQRRRSERGLKRIVNMKRLPLESVTAIQPGTTPSPVGLSFDRKQLIALALQKRMDMFDNELQLAIDKISVDVASNQALPDVNLNFSYSFAGTRTGFDDALDTVLDSETNSGTVGVFVDVPLALNQSARARKRQSELTRRQTLVRRAALQLTVREDVLNAVDAVEQDWQRVLANRHALALAVETYEVEKAQFAVGAITSTEVLRALTAKANAEQAYALANSDYHNSMVDLAFATGTILSESGIRWPEHKETK